MWIPSSSTADKHSSTATQKTLAKFVLFPVSKSSDNLDAGITGNFSIGVSLSIQGRSQITVMNQTTQNSARLKIKQVSEASLQSFRLNFQSLSQEERD